ncbi:MAG: F0F1 ATP synthase subunit A [Coriobacteriia bacterium]|nr:F0F1 ATP synthase subunit A [Coriobacteriia bacterium]
MSAPVAHAVEAAAEVSPITEKIGHLLHELSVIPFSESASFSLTNYTFWLIVAIILLLVFFTIGSRKVKLVPSGIGNLAEAGVEFVRNGICVDVMGPEGKKYFPFLGTMFFFVLFNNLLGNIPPALPGTGTVGTTFTWAIIVFIVYNGIGIKKVGFFKYIKSFVPHGTPWALAWLIFILEILSHLLRPFTLGLRLFANMYAGHVMLGVFAIFAALFIEKFTAVSVAVVPLSVLMQIVLRVFELIVAILQAYIFSILTAVYIDGALHAGEH